MRRVTDSGKGRAQLTPAKSNAVSMRRAIIALS